MYQSAVLETIDERKRDPWSVILEPCRYDLDFMIWTLACPRRLGGNPMKTAILLVPALLLSTAVTSLLADEPSGQRVAVDAAPAQRLLAAGRQMISDFKVTHYSHKTLIDREHGICEVDCSGFLVALLKQTSLDHLRQIATRHKQPLAKDFYQTFAPDDGEVPRGWKQIERMQDVEPGDIIAWIKLERAPGDNTGHVLLVEEKPMADSPDQFRVRVLDSTAHGHGHDSRPEGKSGIGRGTIWLDVDDDGQPVAFRWKSRNGRPHEVPIAIGRAVALRK